VLGPHERRVVHPEPGEEPGGALDHVGPGPADGIRHAQGAHVPRHFVRVGNGVRVGGGPCG